MLWAHQGLLVTAEGRMTYNNKQNHSWTAWTPCFKRLWFLLRKTSNTTTWQNCRQHNIRVLSLQPKRRAQDLLHSKRVQKHHRKKYCISSKLLWTWRLPVALNGQLMTITNRSWSLWYSIICKLVFIELLTHFYSFPEVSEKEEILSKSMKDDMNVIEAMFCLQKPLSRGFSYFGLFCTIPTYAYKVIGRGENDHSGQTVSHQLCFNKQDMT